MCGYLRMIVPSCVLVVRCHSMRVCRVGAGGELCQMLFGNLEGWRLSVFYYRYCVRYCLSVG